MVKKASKKSKADLTDTEYLSAYKSMLYMRRFEEKAGQLYGMGHIGGFCHLYIGQEAVIQGVSMAKNVDDQLITGYRDHAHLLVTGMEPKYIMAELTGKASGCSKGKGGSMHMFNASKLFFGGHGIVGAQVPLGTGMAFANKYKKNKAVSLVFFGDGAANQGQVYESFNMAALWSLPVVYVIENNQYAMGTSIDRSASQKILALRGQSFNIPGEQVNGMDVAEVKKATEKALKHSRSGKGPYILEMLTYRYRGHSMSDPAKYRTREEVKKIRELRDPIDFVKNILIERKIITEEELKSLATEIKKDVDEVANFAIEDAEPSLDELYTDVVI